MAKEADLALDEDLQFEVHQQLGKHAAKRQELLADGRMQDFAPDESHMRRRESKAHQKEAALKQKYDREIENQKFKKFANSSYLTPEAAIYLNEVMESTGGKVDEEVVYAGLHQPSKGKMKFTRT